MNKKIFSINGMLSSLTIFFFILTVIMLNSMEKNENILDKIKGEKVNAQYCSKEQCSLLNNYGTATSSDIISGKTALVSGQKITGTLERKTVSSITLSNGASKTYSSGYYPNAWTVSCR